LAGSMVTPSTVCSPDTLTTVPERESVGEAARAVGATSAATATVRMAVAAMPRTAPPRNRAITGARILDGGRCAPPSRHRQDRRPR
jgi:hypothetical protein